MKKLFTSLLTIALLQCAFTNFAFAETSGTEQTVAVQSALININTASESQLSSLPGIGKSKAKAIIEYRELNGEFSSIQSLTNVKGIGDRMLGKLKGKITV
ncbi:helix-hairpin-helix domain-containing protein [Paraneptunicella aestuarii]|uniref:ComEA family DNA-binding protein n=1 Tax=Paraneptunicella aestuarii TaxID=2831148 RepID=UPI001E5B18D6|nr:ComEA family DNA-binding protein [Paraneptunicella aestuarii]UAA39688.1 helix-hairpin-helix domain-containing protein [Paraneptunicella aestuarii]